MDQRLYGMSAPTLHHYPHSLPGGYGLGQSLQRHSPFSSVYGGTGLGYSYQDWSSAHASAGFNLNGTYNGTSSFLSSRDSNNFSSVNASRSSPNSGCVLKTPSQYCSPGSTFPSSYPIDGSPPHPCPMASPDDKSPG